MIDTYELRTSQYDHPDATRGQHTNGPAKLFVRSPGGPWYRVRIQTAACKVRLMIETYGIHHFIATYCDPVPSEPSQ